MASETEAGLEALPGAPPSLPVLSSDFVAAVLRQTELLFGGRPELVCDVDPSAGELLYTIEVHVFGEPKALVEKECQWLAMLASLGGRGLLGLRLMVDREA